MLELQALGKRWADFALRHVTLHVDAGDYFVLLGPSGAGKSLLLETIAGFHRPDTGRVLLAGRDVTDDPPERRNVGLCCQDSMLFPHRTVAANIAYGLHARRLPRRERDRRVRDAAAMLRIEDLLDRAPATLSGGEGQRVSLARALAIRPTLLLLDEPLGALDPPVQAVLRAELKRVHRRSGVTVVHVTHNHDEAREMAGHVGILRGGRLVQSGPPAEVFDQPQDAFIARFTGCPNVYSGVAELRNGRTILRCGSTELICAVAAEGPVRAAVQPESVFVSTEPVRTSARNQLAGEVLSVEPRGRVFAVTGKFGQIEITSVVTPQSVQELALAPGRRVFFSFKASSLHIMNQDDSEP
jgi:molybdate/tungstate transport system ATP-binding protein